jgi:hypothetical protein
MGRLKKTAGQNANQLEETRPLKKKTGRDNNRERDTYKKGLTMKRNSCKEIQIIIWNMIIMVENC